MKKCFLCHQKINISDVMTDDEELAIDVDNYPICPHCFRKIQKNVYIKRVFEEWENSLGEGLKE